MRGVSVSSGLVIEVEEEQQEEEVEEDDMEQERDREKDDINDDEDDSCSFSIVRFAASSSSNSVLPPQKVQFFQVVLQHRTLSPPLLSHDNRDVSASHRSRYTLAKASISLSFCTLLILGGGCTLAFVT